MKQAILVLFLSIPLLHLQAQNTDYREAIAFIEAWLEAQKDFEQLPGISAIAVKDQEVIWQGAFGLANKSEMVEMDPSTICSICSISKLFTSIAIMNLYEEGKLRLDDEIADLLPWYDLRQKFPESGPITVRALLTHSAGLPRESAHPYWTGPDFPFPSRQEIREALEDQETLYPASTYYQYSNLGLALLGEVVAEVSGQPFDHYIEENILQPLQMEDTRTELPEDLYGKQLAIGYSALARDGEREKVNFFQANGIKPAAGFSSTVIDLAKFASWQLRLRDTTTEEILRPSTLKNMQRVHWTDPDWGRTRGLGFGVYKGSDGSTWIGHGGSCPGYRSTLRINPESGMGYAVMINAGGTNPGKFAGGIHAILKKLGPKEKDEAEEDPEVPFEDYSGYYSYQPWGAEVFVSPSNGKLVAMWLPNDDPAESMMSMKHVEGDTFRRIRDDGELGETITFIRDRWGQVTRMEQHGNYAEKIGDQ